VSDHNMTHPVGRRSMTGIHHADDCPMRNPGASDCVCGREGERGPRITDEARSAGLEALHADSEWHRSDGAGVWRANYKRAVDLVLEAAAPHLTDDGAGASTEASSPPAEATPPPAPSSSPRITDEAVEAATRALARTFVTNKPVAGTKDFRVDARAALEAALPHLAPQLGVTEDLREALEQLRENWSLEEIVREAIREAEWCCEVGCGSGACETCPCCCAGYCVSGRDGLPNDDPEEVGRWLEIAAEHNPAIAALRPHLASQPAVDRRELLKLLEDQGVISAKVQPALAYRQDLADAVLALINGSAK